MAGLRRGVVCCALLLAACSTGGRGEGVAALTPRDGRSGLQLSGTVEGAQVVVSAGAPELLIGDCDPNDGFDRDVCFLADALGGEVFVLSIENPEVLVEGAVPGADGSGAVVLKVVSDCASPEACDAVTEGIVVDLQTGVGERLRATGGTVRVDAVEPLRRYAGEVNLDLPDGQLSGTFDVVPRPDDD